jgi:hypothetical protein
MPSMKKIIFFISAIFFASPGFCQTVLSGRYMGSDGIQRDYQFLDGENNPIPIGDRGCIEGSPLLQSKWTFGILKLQNGQTIADSALNYSLYNNKLFFERNGSIYQVNKQVNEFFIQPSIDPSADKFFHFQKGFPAIDQNDYSSFYEVLFDGISIKLLKKDDKNIQVSYQYSGPIDRHYYTLHKFYVFIPKENRLIELGKRITLKDLRKNLTGYAAQIDAYTAAHKITNNEEADFLGLFEYLDKPKS